MCSIEGNWRIFPLDAPTATFSPFKGPVDQWRAKRGERPFPRWNDYDIGDFAGWYGWISLNRVDPRNRDVLVELFGTRLSESLGIELTGRTLRDPALGFADSYVDRVYAHFADIVTRPGIGLRSVSLAPMGREHVTGWILDLPVSKSGNEATHVMTFTTRTSVKT